MRHWFPSEIVPLIVFVVVVVVVDVVVLYVVLEVESNLWNVLSGNTSAQHTSVPTDTDERSDNEPCVDPFGWVSSAYCCCC